MTELLLSLRLDHHVQNHQHGLLCLLAVLEATLQNGNKLRLGQRAILVAVDPGIGCSECEQQVSAKTFAARKQGSSRGSTMLVSIRTCPNPHIFSSSIRRRTVHPAQRPCVCGLLQTDPQERAKTTTASSGCRPRPTAPDPVVSHGNSHMQATAGQTNAGEATTCQQARNREVRTSIALSLVSNSAQLRDPEPSASKAL